MSRALVWLVLALLAPLAQAQGERAAALVQYVEGASSLPPDGLAERLPATRVDGAHFADRAPEGRPESALAHFRELQRLLLLRTRTGAPVSIGIDARFEGDAVVADITLASSSVAAADITAVVVEDGVRLALPGGEADARFVARALDGPARADLAPMAGLQRRIPLDAAWDRERLLLVVYASIEGEAAQAAVWRSGQAEPTRQTAKLPLVEHATAAWCQPCVASDDSFALLANQQGEVGAQGGRGGYARAPDLFALGGLLAGALGALALLRRRTA